MTSVHGNASLCPSACTVPIQYIFSSMFTLSFTEVDSQPNVVSHYGQVYISKKVCISGPTFITFFSCFGGAHSPSFQSLHLRHSSFSNPSLALPTSQLILQPFRCFTYVTNHSPDLLSLLLRHRIFTYVTWRAAHVKQLYV